MRRAPTRSSSRSQSRTGRAPTHASAACVRRMRRASMASASGAGRLAEGEVDPFSAKQATVGYPDVPPAATALLAVDLVNDYTDPAGAMPALDCGPVLEANRRLADAARKAGVTIAWLRPGHLDPSDRLFRPRL